MPENSLRFVIPMPQAWDDAPHDGSAAEITLKPATAFDVTPIGGVLDQELRFVPAARQWRAGYEGAADVTVSFRITQGRAPAAASWTIHFAESQGLRIDFSEPEPGVHVLLRGSLRILLGPAAVPALFREAVAALWPTGNHADLVALRLEPAGLHLEGRLPAALFPKSLTEDRDAVDVVLRVPQLAWDVGNARALEPGKRFWTLGSFDFGLTTATEVLQGYALDVGGFRDGRGRSYVDNVAASPQAGCAMRIFRAGDGELAWQMSDLRGQLRIQLGGGDASEAAFHPDEIAGRARRAGGAWRRVPLTDGGPGAVVVRTSPGPEATSTVTLGLRPDGAVLALEEKIAELSFPTASIAGPQELRENQPHPETWRRAWLCTDRGWLRVDARPQGVTPRGPGPGAGAIQGVVELEKIMAFLSSTGGQPAPPAGADALQVQLSAVSSTSVALGVEYDGAVTALQLVLGDPLVTVVTPGVWYVAPAAGEPGRDDSRSAAWEALPALSLSEGAPPLEGVFRKASFISAGGATAAAVKGILAWSGAGFRLDLEAEGFRLWQPIPDLPLAQTFGRTPDPARGSQLDANRGLIPFEPTEKVVPLSFATLASLPTVTNAPVSRKDFRGWRLTRPALPLRYFLPTLPGVEATLPLGGSPGAGEGAAALRWGYRHAVPALDDAYAEAAEDPAEEGEALPVQGRLDFTRVEGAEAFEIREGEQVPARGWLGEGADPASGQTPLKVAGFTPEGRTPRLEVLFQGGAAPGEDRVVFSRADNVDGFTGTLSGERIVRNGQELQVRGAATRDAAGLQWDEISATDDVKINRTRLTPPGTTTKESRWTGSYSLPDALSDEGTSLRLELMGVCEGDIDEAGSREGQAWALHDGAGDWPSLRGWPLFPLRLTHLHMDDSGQGAAAIEAVLMPAVPVPPVLSLTPEMALFLSEDKTADDARGTNVDGSFSVTLGSELRPSDSIQIDLPSRRWPLHPPDVALLNSQSEPVDIKIEPGHHPGGHLMLVSPKSAVPAGRVTIHLHTPMPEHVPDAPAASAGLLRLELALDGGEIVGLSVAPVPGQDGFDWRFQAPPGEPLSLLRLKGEVNRIEQLGPEGSTLTGLALQHPLGVIDLERGLGGVVFEFRDDNNVAGALRVEPALDALDYNMLIKREGYVFEHLTYPYRVARCLLRWRFKMKDGAVAQLLYCNDRTIDDLRPCNGADWSLRINDASGRALLGPLCLGVPLPVDADRFLFQVAAGSEADCGGPRAWLKATRATGVIGVTFTADRLEIASLTADLRVDLEDRYADDAILLSRTAATRVAAQVHLDGDGLTVELTGRLALQNNIDYVLKRPATSPHCTHRIELYFDRAVAPAEAVFLGTYRDPTDAHTAALAHHVFRFPDGEERIWQAPQVVRFTSLQRFARLTGMPEGDEQRREDLVLDASAVFWLRPAQWAEAARYGVGAAAISNDAFCVWLLPRELRSFERGTARAVRLLAAACWAFDNAPFEVRTGTAAPRVEIPAAGPEPDLAYWTSGVHRVLPAPQPPADDARPAFFARGAESAWLNAAQLMDRLHSAAADGGEPGWQPGVRPPFGPGSAEGQADLLWLKNPVLVQPQEGPPPGQAAGRPNDFIRGDSAFLASATLAHREPSTGSHPPDGRSLDGPTLFEFPYRLRLQELNPEGAAADKFHAQLLVFDKVKGLVRLAEDRLAPDTTGRRIPAAVAWAESLLEQRRRHDAAFVLVEYGQLIPVPRRAEAAYEEAVAALPGGGDATAAAPDPRRRLPSLHGAGASWGRTWLRADERLGLRVFEAAPAEPAGEGARIVAATRFRLARAGGDSRLARPLVEPPADGDGGPRRRLHTLTQLDDAPFEVYGPHVNYARPASAPLAGQAATGPTRSEADETHGAAASLLPPLVDVVSWAARPGEMVRSSWSARVHRLSGPTGNGGLVETAIRSRHPVSVSLRRPRSRAGEREAVRLIPGNTNPLLGHRFVRTDFLLQQDLDKTSPDELKASNVQFLLATPVEVFKSGATRAAAEGSPAFFTIPRKPGAEPRLALYVVATEGLGLAPQPANTDKAEEVVALHRLDGDLAGDSQSFFESLAPKSVALWADSPLWQQMGQLRMARLDDRAVSVLLDGLEEAKAALYVLARHTREPENGEWRYRSAPKALAHLSIQRLHATDFTPPKSSVALLSWPKGGDGAGPVALAGYGRLGPEDFSLVAPRLEGADLIWARTANLQVLHRSGGSNEFGYDVVVYGPGGEMIRTA